MSKRIWMIESRKKKGLSRSEVASFLGITQQYYSYIENGKKRPSPELAQKLGKILGFDWTLFYQKKVITRV